jgi:8-oxo-dGTP pyrophosphatase MutT (NUDIX family)
MDFRVPSDQIMPDAKRAPWKILNSEIVIDTPHLRLRRDRIETPRGDIVDNYHVRETRGFVVVFALTPHDEVVFVRQYKHGIGDIVFELPAGAIDPNETPAQAAAREFVEETGYVVEGQLELVRSFIADPTNSNGRFTLFFGRGARQSGRQHFDPTEDIKVELVPRAGLRQLLTDGTIEVGTHVAAIYTMLDRLGSLG